VTSHWFLGFKTEMYDILDLSPQDFCKREMFNTESAEMGIVCKYKCADCPNIQQLEEAKKIAYEAMDSESLSRCFEEQGKGQERAARKIMHAIEDSSTVPENDGGKE